MGNKKVEINIHTGYFEKDLRAKIKRIVKTDNFTYQIDRKSLDARKKSNIHWVLRIIVNSKSIQGSTLKKPVLDIPYRKRKETITVVGSGPAGFFCAYVLQKAGFTTTIVERGQEVLTRSRGIKYFENSGIFDSENNYSFGEGGAGTFSDGKLTSRSKRISVERDYILNTYVEAGAPEEILYMVHPHLGSDNLINIVKNLRESYMDAGGTILFGEKVVDISTNGRLVISLGSEKREFIQDRVVFATGHSAYDTYRMLMKRDVQFRTKNFAIGSRVEHQQAIINRAQWGVDNLPGVKAAEYRLAFNGSGLLPVYTFCMCPGGKIVPSGAFPGTNIVNGMSMYKRDGLYANSACVAGVNLKRLTGKDMSPQGALMWVEDLEHSFFEYTGNYSAPSCSIKSFITRKESPSTKETSFPFGLMEAPLWELLPREAAISIGEALVNFSGKMKGFDSGIIMGLESKTSSPVQVARGNGLLCAGFDNFYMIGEGSGHSGGIVSSAAEGVKAALQIIEEYS